MLHLVAHTQNDIPVYVDLVGSEAAKHIAAQPYLLHLAAEVLQDVTVDKPVVSLEYDMKRTIGYDFVIETAATDTVFYVRLVRDKTYTRFIKNGKPSPARHLSLVLRRDDMGTMYNLHSIRIGRLVQPRPGSAEETPRSKTYWQTHAVVFDNQPMQSNTLTKTWPY